MKLTIEGEVQIVETFPAKTTTALAPLTVSDMEKSEKYLGLRRLVEKLPRSARETFTLPAEVAEKVNKTIEVMAKGGLSTRIAMSCTGYSCVFSTSCPLVQENLVTAIIGSPCPFEESLIEIWKEKYVDALDINPENKIEMDRVNDLIESDIIDMRTSGMLSLGQLFDEQPIGFDRHGEVVTRKELGVAVTAKMQFKERKDKIIKEFMATREMRAKYRISKNVDPSSYSANLLQQAAKFSPPDIEDADFSPSEEEN